MQDIQQISHKVDKQLLFEVDLDWVSKQKGVLSNQELPGKIQVATPPVFGGEENEWSPEHLFLGSVSSCFMTTYLNFAKKFGFSISGFECKTTGQIELVEGKYQFTQIDIFAKVYIPEELLKQKANLVLEKTQKYCLVANSISARKIYHGEVLLNTPKDIKDKVHAIL